MGRAEPWLRSMSGRKSRLPEPTHGIERYLRRCEMQQRHAPVRRVPAEGKVAKATPNDVGSLRPPGPETGRRLLDEPFFKIVFWGLQVTLGESPRPLLIRPDKR